MWMLTLGEALATTVGLVHDGVAGDALMRELVAEVTRVRPDTTWVQSTEPDLDAALAEVAAGADVLLVVGPVASAVARRRALPPIPVVTTLDLGFGPGNEGVWTLPVDGSLGFGLALAERLTDGDTAVVVSDALYAVAGRSDLLRVGDPVPDGVGAVVTAGLEPLGTEERQQLYAGWTAAGLVSVAMNGHIQDGATAVVRVDALATALGRRLALVLDDLEAGRTPRLPPVPLGEPEVVLAVDVLEGLGRSAPFDLLAEARLVRLHGDDATLSLGGALERAFAESPSLRAERSRLEADDAASWSAVARWAPRVTANLAASAVDPKLAGAVQPSAQVGGTVVAEQVIWSDAALTGLKVRDDLNSARDHERIALEQDLARDVLSAYVGVLRTQAVLAVHRADLDRVREARTVAERQLEVGAGTPWDVARWQSEEASARSNLVGAYRDYASASLALDQVCGVAPDGVHRVEDVDVEAWGSVALVDRPDRLERIASVVAEASVERSPRLEQLNASHEAQVHVARMTARSGWMPTIAGQVGLKSTLWNADVDPIAFPGIEPITLVPDTPNVGWTAGLNASVPLFGGGVARANTRSERASAYELEQRRRALEQTVAIRARRAVQEAHARRLALDLAQERVASIHVSLDAVTEAYAAGAVPQTRLTEVRTSTLAAEIQAADASYALFQAGVDLLYALSALPTPSTPDGPLAARSAVTRALEAP